MTTYKKTFRIDRKKWQRGKPAHMTFLWDEGQQKGCCLGHVIHQTSKCSWNNLTGMTTPKDYYSKPSVLTMSKYTKALYNPICEPSLSDITDNTLADEAMSINDDMGLPEPEREDALIHLFNRYGYKLEFYN